MGKVLSIALFVLFGEASQAYLYAFMATRDLAKIGLLGPIAGALTGAAVVSLLEQLWPRLHSFSKNVIFVSIVLLFISAGTTYYRAAPSRSRTTRVCCIRGPNTRRASGATIRG